LAFAAFVPTLQNAEIIMPCSGVLVRSDRSRLVGLPKANHSCYSIRLSLACPPSDSADSSFHFLDLRRRRRHEKASTWSVRRRGGQAGSTAHCCTRCVSRSHTCL